MASRFQNSIFDRWLLSYLVSHPDKFSRLMAESGPYFLLELTDMDVRFPPLQEMNRSMDLNRISETEP